MKVENIMTVDVKTCSPHDTLHSAAQIMWEHECGCVPVVDENFRVVGMLTDREICMAAHIHARPLQEISVAAVLSDDPLSNQVWSCTPDDTLKDGNAVMREYKVRRLPVIGSERRLVGILSLSDLAQEAARERGVRTKKEITARDVGETLAVICEPVSAEECTPTVGSSTEFSVVSATGST